MNNSAIKRLNTYILLSTIGIVVILFVIGYVSYSYYLGMREGGNSIVAYGDISIEFCQTSTCSGGNSNMGKTIGMNNGTPVLLYPMTKEEAIETNPYIFKVTNTGDYKMLISIKLKTKTSPALNSSYSTFTAINEEYLSVGIGEVGASVNSMLFSELNNDIILTVVLDPSESKTYSLWAWVNNSVNNDLENVYFLADIFATGEVVKTWYDNCDRKENQIGCKIISDNLAAGTLRNSAPDFTETPGTNFSDYGLYKTSESYNDIYYFRGGDAASYHTLNNNVIFANKCWQIVRTNEDGSVRIVYNGVPSLTGECTSTGADIFIGGSVFNLKNITNSGTDYATFGDVTMGGYMYSNPLGHKYTLYKGAYTSSLLSFNSATILFGTGYEFNETTGQISITEAKSITDIIANEGSVDFSYYKYTCTTTSALCTTSLFEVDPANIIYNSMSDIYSSNGMYRYLSVWTKNEAEATKNEVSSTIKNTLETWYTNNIERYYGEFVADAGYCNDRTVSSGLGYGAEATTYSAYSREVNPSYICPFASRDLFTVNNEVGNGRATKPIGLLTKDEMIYAGSTSTIENPPSNFYLYADNTYWTMSPKMQNDSLPAMQLYLNSEVRLFNNEYYVRPVISLKANTIISGGTGTKTSPYTI